MFQKSYPQLLWAALKHTRHWLISALIILLITGSSFLALPQPAYTADAPPVYIGQWESEFSLPFGVAVDNQNNVYVADLDNSYVKKFDSSGVYLTQWGTYGNDNGQFMYATSIAVDSQNNVYVGDELNHRIQKFDSNGGYLTQWGQFNSPWGIAAGSNVYVADYGNQHIQKFTRNGGYLTQFGSLGISNGHFNGPAVAVDSRGNVYVADTWNHRVQKFDSNGGYLTQWGAEGTSNGQFEYLDSIAVDSRGNVYVGDPGNNRVQKFTSSGGYLTQWGSEGSGNGQFSYPHGVAVDSSGNIYVVDTYNRRIQKFGTPAAKKLTVVLDAQPLQSLNFRFSGDLGGFKLRDKKTKDENKSKTVMVKPGVYTVAEQVPTGWYLDIACTPAGGMSAVNLATSSVAVTMAGGQDVTCVFTNQQSALVRVLKYDDRNGNGKRNSGEPYLSGWTVDLYDSQGALVGRQVTNTQGKASFTNVRPGILTICENQQNGWFNSQPGSTEPTYGQPCYTQMVLPGVTAAFTFGNTTTQPASVTSASEAAAGVLLTGPVDTTMEADEDAYPAPVTDEAFLNAPEPETQDHAIYLPLISQ